MQSYFVIRIRIVECKSYDKNVVKSFTIVKEEIIAVEFFQYVFSELGIRINRFSFKLFNDNI